MKPEPPNDHFASGGVFVKREHCPPVRDGIAGWEGGVIFCNAVSQPCEEPELMGCGLKLSYPHWHRIIVVGSKPVIEWDVEASFTEE
ncbi:hypothetical protein A2Z67_04870 [Candidatus Woesebacteria bacterium RBG_13_36_22]|uniref:Uncharacterized protein n=1 Tax=Candidatus Woesebacteria bacterium RBG_13_36_22 TaxID=1802478 RepID=A0A1F7X2Y7_9BACT|nr:MAG: hypothetical protein A2Z67_04870 [Candidatus Woesebacteria bacterium RBG_13_36_22]